MFLSFSLALFSACRPFLPSSFSIFSSARIPSSTFYPPYFPISFTLPLSYFSQQGSVALSCGRGWFMIDWQGRRRHINQEAAVELCHNANGVLIECWMALNNGSGFSVQSMHITTMGWQCAFTVQDTSHNAMMLFSVICCTITGKHGCLCLHIRGEMLMARNCRLLNRFGVILCICFDLKVWNEIQRGKQLNWCHVYSAWGEIKRNELPRLWHLLLRKH